MSMVQGKTRQFSVFQVRLLAMGLKFNIDTGMQMTSPKKIGGTPYAIAKKRVWIQGRQVSGAGAARGHGATVGERQ